MTPDERNLPDVEDLPTLDTCVVETHDGVEQPKLLKGPVTGRRCKCVGGKLCCPRCVEMDDQ